MKTIEQLLQIMQQLRDPNSGCPWDLEQTFASLVPHTLEESYEVADAIERAAFDELRDELGDLLFQVVFYAQIADEMNLFDFSDIAGAIAEKLIRRHPHVFADEEVHSAEHQTEQWEEHKRRERQAKQQAGQTPSELDGVIQALPALSRAQKIQRRAARVGFDWDAIEPVYAKVQEEIQEVYEAQASGNRDEIEAELGDLLFAVVNVARFLDVDAENALRRATAKFERRFRDVETQARIRDADMRHMSLTELDALWEAAKRTERGEST